MKNQNYLFSGKSLYLAVLLIWSTQFVFSSSTFAQDVFDPPALYATWIDDPTTTMSIIWQSEGDNGNESQDKYSKFEYRLKNKTDGKWEAVKSEDSEFPFSDRIMHRVDLKEL